MELRVQGVYGTWSVHVEYQQRKCCTERGICRGVPSHIQRSIDQDINVRKYPNLENNQKDAFKVAVPAHTALGKLHNP